MRRTVRLRRRKQIVRKVRPLVELLAGLPVEAREQVAHVAHGAPIRHHEAGEMPLPLQNIGEQVAALTCVRTVVAVVRAHHRARLTDLDRDLEREQVAVVRGRVGQAGVDDVAAGLLRVEREMLHRRDHVRGLDRADRLASERASQERILAEILEVAAVARLAREIDAAGEEHVEALRARLFRDLRAAAARDFPVPGRSQRERRRQRGRAVMTQAVDPGDAEARVRFAQCRDAEARNARRERRRDDCAVGQRLASSVRARERAVQQADTLRVRHPRLQRGGALVG